MKKMLIALAALTVMGMSVAMAVDSGYWECVGSATSAGASLGGAIGSAAPAVGTATGAAVGATVGAIAGVATCD